MVKTAPASSFIMSQSEFLLQFLVVALDDPTMFGQSHQISKLHVFGQSGEPVLGRFGFRARPLDEESFLSARFTTPVIAMSGTTRRAAKRERRGVRVPSRQCTVFQAEADKLLANSRTERGACRESRRNNLVGRPIPFHFLLGSGAWPGAHALTEDWMPTA